ncbi:molybdopterin-dependent oxidoreductase [Rubeoparvulum massiliense]|uniref:molybdopterin-dependent oxidoreductase n=1 Tax=Rubeoparvulum massiliense TaxID=1631346 RepID=UPI00065DF128|nr:molybdopterin-dependent oxidoreductase [Rubeoparvulum massiliense]
MTNAEYILYLGAYPGKAGKPMQTIARQAAVGTTTGHLKYTVVDPVMMGGGIGPNGNRTKWVPIKPTTDGAFALALIQWILANRRYNEAYLSAPNLEAAQAKGYNSFCNASYLVIMDEQHPNYRKLLRAEDLGLPVPENDGKEDFYVVIDKATRQPKLYSETTDADIFYAGALTAADGTTIHVKSSLLLLKESADSHDMEFYSKECGIPVATIVEIAKEFTSHGTKVAVDGLGGTASSTGLQATAAHYALCALVGSTNMKGGNITRRNNFSTATPGPRYDLKNIEGAPKPAGMLVGRTGARYEDTTEYKQKVAQGENPYPSKFPWHPVGGASDNQAVFAAINGYPYQTKILFTWMSNPVMTTPAGAKSEVVEGLKDVNKVPLFIASDAFMGETTSLADYIIPDTTPYESWGTPNIEGNFSGKGTTVRWPVVKALTEQLPDGRYACLENYIIDVAKAIGVPGYGDKALKDKDGNDVPVNNPAEYFLRIITNMAFDDSIGKVAPDITDEEIQLMGLGEELEEWKKILKPDEWRKALYVMSRGGRFESREDGFDGEFHKYGYKKVLNLYVESLATARNSFTGEYFPGVLVYEPETFADGTLLTDKYPESEWPFKGVSYKANFRSVTMLANSSILTQIHDTNYVEVNIEDAEQLGLKNGDRVKLISATGGEEEGILLARQGVAKGTVAIAFGYGHWQYGVKSYEVGNETIPGDERRGKGVNLARISLLDPTVEAGIMGFSEMSTGIPSRNGGAFRIERV